jgi:hypothetical protein
MSAPLRNALRAKKKMMKWTPADEDQNPPEPGALYQLKSKLYILDSSTSGGVPVLVDVNSQLHSGVIPKGTLAVYMGSGRETTQIHGKRSLVTISHFFMVDGRVFSIQRLREVVPVTD